MNCCTNGVAGYLKNKVTVKELQSYLNDIKQMKFELSFDVSSYHYEKRRHYDSKSKRYVTEETFNYPVGESIDETENSSQSIDVNQTEEEKENCVGLKTTLLACQDGVKEDRMLSMTVYIIYCFVGLSLLS
ncbi:hypothetical protein ABPG72_008841 [Tetrahymena utriculariae]